MNKTDLIDKFESAIKAVTDSGWMQSKTWAEGIWQLRPPQGRVAARFMISLVVHGDETGPVQIVLNLLAAWQQLGASPPVELTVVLGNLEAWSLGKRYVEQDMNRLFAAQAPQASTTDARRALVLRQTLEKMRLHAADLPSIPLIHFDLHSTIRPSLKPTFAMVPAPAAAAPDAAWLSWLTQQSGLDALVLTSDQASTLSAYTARHGAWSCTVELGQVGAAPAADSPHSKVVEPVFAQALADWVLGPQRLCGPGTPVFIAPTKTPQRHPADIFRVTHEVIRSSDTFELLLPPETCNFSPLEPGQLVARDAQTEIRAQQPGTCVLFPNPHVAVGLRAALLIAPL
jgi:succinylglutamate desuccinylase